jgi:hypothetical protein
MMFVLMLLQRLMEPSHWVLAPALRLLQSTSLMVMNGTTAGAQQATRRWSPHRPLVLAPIPIRRR